MRRRVSSHVHRAARSGLALLLALACALVARAAAAHQTSVVYLDVALDGRRVELGVRIGADDLGEPLGLGATARPTREQAATLGERAARYVAERVSVRNGGAVCSPRPGGTTVRERADGFALAIAVRYVCARQVDDLRLRYDLFFDVDPRHQAFAEVRAFGAVGQRVLRADARELHVAGQPSRLAQLGEYLELGVEHIFTGYDHIAFLIGLLLIAGARGLRGGARYALGVVTAFTLAHSITLAAAALGWVRVSSRLVESAIALSIAYVALENLRRAEPRHRWLLTFAFGLVHGFGFATVLGETGLPARGILPSLLAFNAGVELGQLAIVAAAFPFLHLVHQARWRGPQVALGAALLAALFVVLYLGGVGATRLALVLFVTAPALAVAGARLGYRRGVRVGASALIAAFALFWLLERITGRVLFRGALG